jgi:hypothetical protein
MSEVNAGYNQQVTALFGLGGDPKFSKKLDRGMTHDDMADLHSYAGQHHHELAKYHSQMARLADTKQERIAAKKEANKHGKLAEKHKQLAQHFERSAPSNKPSIVKPAMPTKQPYTPPSSSTPSWSSKPFPQNAPASGPSSSPQHSPSTLPSTNLAGPGPTGPSKAFKAGQKVAKIADNYNSNLGTPARAVGKSMAKLWKGLSPHVRNRFVKAKPNKPISQSWMRGNPRLPLPANDLAKMHQQQADYHAGQATQAVTPETKSSHIADANHHAKMAQGWIKKAVSEKSAPPQATQVTPPNVPKPKTAPKAASAPKPVKTSPGAKPKAKPPSTVKPTPKPAPTKKLAKAPTKPKMPTPPKKPVNKVKPINPAKL